MPRQARLDVPGHMYHVMSRGIERGKIFIDEEDYRDFTERFGVWLNKCGGKCLAWCLMPNHFHFLVLRGERPLAEMMHHVMTGYAVNFNGRRRRAGHLFQNRYKAIICDLEEYLLELVPYIHLNPLRAGLVKDLRGLENYKWCGHAAVTIRAPDEILDRDMLLSHFGSGEEAAIFRYVAVMAEKARDCGRLNLSGGGFLRSFGGINNALRASRSGERILADERILGGGEFVESVLRIAGITAEQVLKSRAELLLDVEKRTGIAREDILRQIRDRGPARARAVYCYLCKERAGASGTELTRELGISQSGISRLIAKGRALIESGKLII